MKKKILFTGNGRVVIDDLIAHVSAQYQKYKCLPMEFEFRNALDKYQPDIVVVALSKETGPMLRMYADLRDRPEYFHLPILAIGSDDDCHVFRNNIFQKNMECFIRPVDMEEFTKTLDELSETSAEINAERADRAEKAERAEKNAAVLRKETKIHASADDPEKLLEKQIERMNHFGNRKSILVVDDDVRMLNVIKMYLEDLYEVTIVPSGKLALKFLNKKHADLVLLDYMMPEEDGPAVLKKIREDSPWPDIPVVFLTGVSDKEKVLKGLEFHPNGYLLKPVKREVLLERVTELLLGL